MRISILLATLLIIGSPLTNAQLAAAQSTGVYNPSTYREGYSGNGYQRACYRAGNAIICN